MAYGDRATGKIPAGSTLKFEVELLDFSNPLTFEVKKHNEGEGPTIPRNSKVSMKYKGYLKDGTVFDENKNSFDFTVGVGQVIKCWDEGVIQLQKGQKATFSCPSYMAYGQRGAGGKIGPNTDLYFDVEVNDFTPPPTDL